MATSLQLRRGTSAENDSFTGLSGEITIDTTNNVVRIHDGSTAGGFATVMANSDQTLISGNIIPAANVTYDLGNTTNYWNNLYLSGTTIYLGPLQLKAIDDTTFAVYTSDGVTQANIDVGNIDVSAINSGTTSIGIPTASGNAVITVGGTANVLEIATNRASLGGAFTATGNITGSYIFGNGSQLTGIDATSIQNGTSNVRTFASANVTVSVAGTPNVAVFTTSGANVAGTIDATGNITGSYIFGNGSQLSGIDATSIQSGTSNMRVVSSGGNVDANVAGSTIFNLSSTGLVITGSIEATNGFVGLDATKISDGTSQMAVLASDGNIQGNVSGAEILLLTSQGANVTGTLGVTGNVTAGNLAGTLLTGTLATASQPNVTSVGTLTSLSVTGNISGGNLSGTSIVGTLTTAAQTNITSLGTLTSLTVNGLTTHTGNIDVTGNINVTGNLNYQDVTDLVVGDPLVYFGANNTGNLYDLGFVVAYDDGLYQHGGVVRDASDGVWKVFGNVVAEPTTVVDFANAIYQPFRSGAATFAGANINGALTGATTISASGNISGGNVDGTRGDFTNIAGTLETAAQPNITSLGTLGSLSVTGNITGGNADLGNLAVANYFSGDGSLLSNLPSSTSLSNGTSNVIIASANANVTISVNSTANVVSISEGALALGGGAVFANPKASSGSGTIPSGVNAMLIGPYEVSDGDTITSPDGSTLIVI